MLRSLQPDSEPIDVLQMLFSEKREREDRPWVMYNMVESVDGATAVKGGASALNDEDDRFLFLAMRVVADVVLVGAQTIRSEDYGPLRFDEERKRLRLEAGLHEEQQLVVLTRSLGIDPSARIFSDPARRPTIITGREVDQDQLAALSDFAEIIQIDNLDGAGIVEELRDAKVILCEGGPTVNSQLIAAGMVDEINVTVSPMVALGESQRIAHGQPFETPIEMRLDRALQGDRSLFLRYVTA